MTGEDNMDFDANDMEDYDENAIEEVEEVEEEDAFPKVAPPTNDDDANTVYLEQSEEETNSFEEEKVETNSVKEEILKQRDKVNFEITDTDAIRMVETFKTIGTSTFELAALADTTIKEVQKVIEIGEKKSEDIKDVADFFYENKEEFLQVLLKFKEYFDSDEDIIYKISKLEHLIQDNYGKFATSLDAMGELHTSIIQRNLGELAKKIGKISDNVDVDSIINNININIDKEFKNIKIDKLEESLNSFEKLNKDFLENSVLLNGTTDGKRGLFYALSDQLDTLDGSLKKLKERFNIVGMISTFVLGAALSGVSVFWYQSSNNIFTANLANQMEINKTLKKLKDKYKGYDGFSKMYGLDGNKKAGFGFFDNNHHPYFYYDPKNLKIYNIRGKNYVDLGESK